MRISRPRSASPVAVTRPRLAGRSTSSRHLARPRASSRPLERSHSKQRKRIACGAARRRARGCLIARVQNPQIPRCRPTALVFRPPSLSSLPLAFLILPLGLSTARPAPPPSCVLLIPAARCAGHAIMMTTAAGLRRVRPIIRAHSHAQTARPPTSAFPSPPSHFRDISPACWAI